MTFGRTQMFKIFEYKDKKLTFVPSVRISSFRKFFIVVIIIGLFSALSGWLKIDEKELWKIYLQLVEHLKLNIELPLLIDTKKKLDAIVELDVDKSIQQALPEYDRIMSEYNKRYLPKYIDEKNDESVCYTDECKALAPPMRICAPWVDNCKSE